MRRELVRIALLLVGASLLLFAAHYLIFRDAHLLFTYLLYDLAFLPLEVLLVTVLIERLLTARERQERQHKMNMVIGAFFSTVGRSLLATLADLGEPGDLAGAAVAPDWSAARIRAAAAAFRAAIPRLAVDEAGLHALHAQLAGQAEFLLRLLENPMLLEHEAFTDLLWAVFHLQEELAARARLRDLPAPDLAHLGTDAERVYGHLIVQWLEYLAHLQQSYPFLYSFAARTNPLRKGARAEVVG